MFFYIGDHNNLLDKVHDRLYLDKGWTNIDNIWYKGYSTDCNLSGSIQDIVNGYQPKGIYCVIQYDNDYRIFHDEGQSFPIYKSNSVRTNIYPTEPGFLSLSKCANDIIIVEKTLPQVIENVSTILINNIKNYKKYNSKEINIWCTGGLDSTSIIALCELAEINYTVYIGKPFNKEKEFYKDIRTYERSINEYSTDLFTHLKKHNWGYELVSLFTNSKQLTTGFYGDEYIGRGPDQLNYIANSLGMTVMDVVKPDQYMYSYLKRKKPPITELNVIDEHTAKQKIYKELYNDFQIWHIDNVETFCPYYDKDIIKECLSLNSNTFLDCGLNGNIQKEILKLANENLLELVDSFKNTISGRVNFEKNISSVKLNYCKEIIWV
jgi:hypothetical protein